ncbi:MAG: hypothetical protein R3F40_09830 [Candidatus Competibacteraceae bacterium]
MTYYDSLETGDPVEREVGPDGVKLERQLAPDEVVSNLDGHGRMVLHCSRATR